MKPSFVVSITKSIDVGAARPVVATVELCEGGTGEVLWTIGSALYQHIFR